MSRLIETWRYLAAVTFVIVSQIGHAFGQSPPFSDEKSFVAISINSVLAIKGPDRTGARQMLAGQLRRLQTDIRVRTYDALFEALRAAPENTAKTEVSSLFAIVNPHWSSSNTGAASAALYELYTSTDDPTLKIALDNALANAQGAYKDAIDDYRDNNLAALGRAKDKLQSYADKYPKSRFAEQASYYVGHTFLKRMSLNDPAGDALIADSSRAFEGHIARAEHGDFSKTDNLAAAYFFRALNGALAMNKADALDWLSKGGAKFSDADRVYIYQLVFSTDGGTVLDRYVPAKSLFLLATNLFKDNATLGADQQIALLSQIRPIAQVSN